MLNREEQCDADELAGDSGGAKLGERGRGLQGEHAAGEEPGQQNDGRGTDADNVGLNEKVGQVAGLAVEVRERAPGEQRIVLYGEHDLFGGAVNRECRH